jgi:transposase
VEARRVVPALPNVALALSLISVDGKVVRIIAHTLATEATCPDCQRPSSHVHDRYARKPMDLPWRGYTVRFSLTVRRLRCPNMACARQTFAEAVGDDLPKHARRTTAATATLLDLVRANGGEGGARLAHRMGLPTSPDTLLRLLRQEPQAAVPTPRVLGVDDFALRRRQRYATVLVDLERRVPIDVLEGRNAATLGKWLQDHIGVEIIVRDRAEAYAEGATQGAPDAQQVADRFHLLKNAGGAMAELLRGHRRSIEHADAHPSPTSEAKPEDRQLSQRERTRRARRARRVERWSKVKELRAAGHSISQIGRELGMDRRTIRNYLATPEVPARQVKNPRPAGFSSPSLQPYQTYLQDRWEQGCTNISQLYREIVKKGYSGSRSLANTTLVTWRSPRPPTGSAKTPKRKSNLRWLCLRPPDQLDADETKLLGAILPADRRLAEGYSLLQQFRRVLAERSIADLRAWIADAQASGLRSFEAFANGIVDDRSAVEAALTTPWSNGPVEGHVHKIKLIKRQGYGRAKLDLLRSRVLAA